MRIACLLQHLDAAWCHRTGSLSKNALFVCHTLAHKGAPENRKEGDSSKGCLHCYVTGRTSPLWFLALVLLAALAGMLMVSDSIAHSWVLRSPRGAGALLQGLYGLIDLVGAFGVEDDDDNVPSLAQGHRREA